MQVSTRWQDYAAIIIGAYTAFSPLWLETNTAAVWSMIILGIFIALAGLTHMARPETPAAEYALAVLGVLLFISPWVLDFAGMTGTAWTAWVLGALTVVVGVAGTPVVSARMHGHGGAAAH